MSHGDFQVRLYAPFPDTDHFPRRLADVLDVSEDRALILLHQVPVVVARNVTAEVAERLAARLRSINAHCIVEGEEAEKEVEGAHREEPTPSLVPEEAAEAHAQALGSNETLRFRLWLGVAAAAAVALACLVVVGYMTAHLDFSPKGESSTQPVKAQRVGEPRPLTAEEKRRGDDLEKVIDELSERFSELTAQRGMLEKEVRTLERQIRPDPFLLRRKQEEFRGLGREIDDLDARIQKLKKELESIGRISEEATR